jgi:thiol-disulfide isomerase/thioredoxin
MRIQGLAVLLALFGACDRAEVPEPESSTHVEPTEIEAEGEARAEAVASRLVGQPAPAVTLTTIEGKKINLTELYGEKPVYLKFWATWCVPCRQQMPEFQRIYEAYGDRMEVIAVNVGYADDEAAVRRYLTEIDLKMPIAVDDGRLADLLDLRVTPQHVLIGLDGRIAYVGHLDGEPFQKALAAVLADSPTTVSAVEHPSPESSHVLKPGEPVGDISVETIEGDEVALGGTGEPRGVLFFSPWCESYLAESRPAISEACRSAREKIEKRAAEGKRKWLAVSDRLWASDADLEQYRRETQTKAPLALDATGDVFRLFGVRQIPAVALIDDGRLIKILDSEALAAADLD